MKISTDKTKSVVSKLVKIAFVIAVLPVIWYIIVLVGYWNGIQPYKPDIDYEDKTDTLKGIDANNNGVRDDIERYIHETWKGADPLIIQAMMNYVRQRTKIFDLDVKNKEAIYEFNRHSKILYYCQDKLTENFSDRYDWISLYRSNIEGIYSMLTNTRIRSKSYPQIDDVSEKNSNDRLLVNTNFFKECGIELSKEMTFKYLLKMKLNYCGLKCFREKEQREYEQNRGEKDEIEFYNYYKENVKYIDPSTIRTKCKGIGCK